ncbi:hypothetical protein CXG81DRAFT_5732, partial [Caulochytrium protostelioides]
TMHLLTYNLFLRPPLIRSGPSDYKEARLEQFACEVLPHYDVVAFQELFAFANGRRDTLLRRARAAGLPHHAVCPVPGLWEGRIDAGLAIVSRFPIVKTALLTYDRGIHSDWLAAKGVLYAKLAVLPNRHVHVFTSHTQASYEMAPGEDSPSRQIRERQLARAARFMVRTLLKTRDRLDDPVLFCGDLNVNARPMAATPPTAEPPSPTPSPRSDAAGAVSLAAAESPKPLTTPASPARRRPFAVFHDLLPRVKGYPPPPTTTNVLPGRTDDGKCLDYIFLVETPVGAAAANPIASGTIKIRDVAVRPFPVSNQPYEHLSDHCGV